LAAIFLQVPQWVMASTIDNVRYCSGVYCNGLLNLVLV